jgi:multiple sugar transport system permease protein
VWPVSVESVVGPFDKTQTTKRKYRFQRAERLFPFFLIAPSILIILLIVVVPLLYSIYVSFTPYTLLKPETLAIRWDAVFRNYGRLLEDGIFWKAFGNTIIYLAVTVNLQLLLGLALSQLLARVTRGQSLLRTILMIPMMFAPVLVGFQFGWFFNTTVGVVNGFLRDVGLIREPIAWLVDVPLGLISIMVADIWMHTPIVTIILLAGTLSLPEELFEAAEVDGASAWQKFRLITYPLLGPFITIALTIRSLDLARAFDIAMIMTGGGPANRTELTWTYIYRLALLDRKFGMGSAMALVTVIVTLLFTTYLFRRLVKSRIIQ